MAGQAVVRDSAAETTPFGDSICAAAREGDVRSLRQLLDSKNGTVNDRESHFGSSALHWAGQFGHVDAAKFLLVGHRMLLPHALACATELVCLCAFRIEGLR